MRYKSFLALIILITCFLIFGYKKVSADSFNSDWIGTLDKSYELAWQQKEPGVYNGYKSYFFLEYTYLMRGTKKYPSYCIEYYKKGPRENSDYGKIKLKNSGIKKSVYNGLIEIIKNGYPNVQYPYGTKDISEAYYATSAAIHAWTMYYDVDNLAGKYLGWFTYKDGFSIKTEDLKKYISDYSTKSTASGWHALVPNNYESSRRTWYAAMKLLLDAIDSEVQEPYINIKSNKSVYLDENYLVYEYIISSNVCKNLKIKLNNDISGSKIEYSPENNNSVLAKMYIPVSSVNSGEKYYLYASGDVNGADDIENYYYAYHISGQYQSMVYLEYDTVREIKSSNISFQVPALEYNTYYDLNHSGKNYIKDSNFCDANSISYKGDKVLSGIGNVNYYIYDIVYQDYNRLRVWFNDVGADNSLCISTLLNDSTVNGFKTTDKKIITFSCWIRTNVATSIKLKFKNSETVYEKNITEPDQWHEISVTMTKSDYESNLLYIYSDKIAVVDFKTMQIETGNIYTEYNEENAGTSEPLFTVHKYGSQYGKLYNGVEPKRENYVFVGWNTQKDGSGIFVNKEDTVPNGHQVLYAIWTTQDTYDVYFHYNVNGGEYLIKNNQIIKNEKGYDVISVPNKTSINIDLTAYRNDYIFLGWTYKNKLSTDAEDSLIDSVYIDGKDVHLYANFKKEHKVRFHYYDEESGSEQVITVSEEYSYNNHPYVGVVVMPGNENDGTAIKIPNVSGYKLKGWAIDKNSVDQVDYMKNESEDLVKYDDYYAVYEKEITVKFYDNVYDTINDENHKGSSYLHYTCDLPVYMNYKGYVTQAELTIPSDYCEVRGYEFYGWSDSRTFNGSIYYYASECGNTVKIESDMKFYSLYVKKYKVRYNDYDFTKKMLHIEKEFYAYEYMNYNGNIYNPEIIIQPTCPVEDGYSFDGWSINGLHSETRYYPEDRYLVNDNVYFFANYVKNIEIRFHELINDSNNDVIMVENIIHNNLFMDCFGDKYSEPVLIPEIEGYEDHNCWCGIGYTDVDINSLTVTHNQNEEYAFYSDTDLYAIYSTDIFVKYYDYSFEKEIPIVKSEQYEMFNTCSNDCKGVGIKISEKLTEDYHDESWWTSSENNSSKDVRYPGEKIIIYNNSDFYAWHSNILSLTCNDLENNVVRTRIFENKSIIDHNGNTTPAKVSIPDQGENNSIIATDYWSGNSDVVADYWSGDTISLYRDIVINAIYEKPVNIIYDSNGGIFDDGTNEIIDTKYAYYNVLGNKNIPVFTPVYKPERVDYVFANIWNSKKDGSGNNYINSKSFASEYDIRLFAVWDNTAEPELSVIDRYYFVGEEIIYNDIVKKIIAIDSNGNMAIENLKIVSINNISSDNLSNSEIENKIVADYPRKYLIKVRFRGNDYDLEDSFIIHIIDRNDSIDRLRYISEDFLDTISYDSKWNYAAQFGKLIISFNKKKENAEYIYTIKKGELE